MENILKSIFLAGVDAVKPCELITKKKAISIHTVDSKEILSICNKHFDITNKNLHIVGFGKGVLAIAAELECVFGNRITSGILSVPIGAQNTHQKVSNVLFKVIEGGAGNFPDSRSLQAAIEIKDKISRLTSEDILLLLITGGGSSLLPLPIAPITLDEKTELIKQLSKAGATINELNIVRIALSQVKGGKLLQMAQNAHQIFSIIISDIIDDPLELIASGPTIPFQPQRPVTSPQSILDRYNITCNLPQSIVQVLRQTENNHDKVAAIKNSHVFLIGNNRIAIDAAMAKTKSLSNLLPVFLSARVQGDVIDISEAFFQLACGIKKFSTLPFDEFEKSISDALKVLHAHPNFVRDLVDALRSDRNEGICIISGGETTISVKSNGIGGRNQELALRFTKLCHDANTLLLDDLLLLTAGSDGIDGNNDAAGAIGGKGILSKVYDSLDKNDVSDVMNDYIFRNDSYNFYKNFLTTYAGESYHLITGHTGTNVMDLQILMYAK